MFRTDFARLYPVSLIRCKAELPRLFSVDAGETEKVQVVLREMLQSPDFSDRNRNGAGTYLPYPKKPASKKYRKKYRKNRKKQKKNRKKDYSS